MEKPARKPRQKILQIDKPAQIEFAAPHSLAECLFRLRDTRHQEPGWLSPGIDPSFEKIDNLTYKFRIRRTWYDTRYRRHHSSVEARGYLRAIDNGTTMVIGRIHFSRGVIVGAVLFVCLLVISLFMPAKNGSNLFMLTVFVIAIGVFAAMLYFDRRTLINLLRTTLDGDV
ncbi:MAG: hypothetical protein K8I30_21020 [Anaerolineae bacterium]|nr:hypothetical protein [Anaerolineae bacterium]